MYLLETNILLKVGKLTLSAAIRGAINICLEDNALALSSFKGKTKKKVYRSSFIHCNLQ